MARRRCRDGQKNMQNEHPQWPSVPIYYHRIDAHTRTYAHMLANLEVRVAAALIAKYPIISSMW